MLSLALDPHLVASAWERVGGSIYSGLGEEEASAVDLDLSGIEASFGVHRAAGNSLGCTTFPPDVYEVGSINKQCIPLSKTATPSTMNCWQSMVQVDLSGSHSPHSGIQQPCNSDGEETMRVPETVADQNDNSSSDPGSVEGQQGALSTGCKSQVDADAASIEDADAASTDDASGQLVQPQLSRANSLSGALRDVPSTPLEPSNSGTSSTESDNSCADLSGSAASAAENTALAVQCIAPTAGVEQKNKSGAAESKAPLCPKAAMAAATAALQRRLLEQQKMGRLLIPGATAASISVPGVQQQSAKIESQQREDATLPCETQTAAVPAAPAAAPVSKLAGIKRDFSALCWQKPASAAAARQLLQHKCPASHAASAGSVGEVFVRTRGEALARYREKRARRSHAKKIRYHLRKVNADKRPRIKGRFVSKEEMEKMGLLAPHLGSANDCYTGQEQSAVLMGEHHAELKIAARAAATAAVGCPWEEQMQHMHLMGADMAAELLQKFDDVVDDHQHQLLAVANGTHVALEAVLEGAGDHPAESEHMLLPPVLEYPGECGLTAAGHEEMPQLPMDFAASDALCLGFHEDFLNDEASEASNHHHDFLML